MARPLRIALTALASALSLWLVAACNTTSSTAENPRIPEASTIAQLRPGDSLNIALLGVPDASSHAVQIDEQGLVSLPFVGALQAAGMTTADLSQRVRQTYIEKKFYTTVDVSVTVTERFVYVGGEVSHPGRIVWTPDLSLSKAVQAAGGFTLYARQSRVNLVRERTSYLIDVVLAQKDPSQDPKLTPGDSVQVPRSAF
jgi:polysaccharide export outer membrane protein